MATLTLSASSERFFGKGAEFSLAGAAITRRCHKGADGIPQKRKSTTQLARARQALNQRGQAIKWVSKASSKRNGRKPASYCSRSRAPAHAQREASAGSSSPARAN